MRTEDTRPPMCRFRRQDEGKSYPRSSCQACGLTVATGLGKECKIGRSDGRMVNPMVEMTLRDHFAMAALTGILANDDSEWGQKTAEHVALGAYMVAAAMLQVRHIGFSEGEDDA